MEEELRDTFAELSPEAQRQVIDFMAFLKSKYPKNRVPELAGQKITDEPFIGMWRDREDLQDSSKWVRSLRRAEW